VHTFVRHNKIFYDSESLDGESDWRDLRATNNYMTAGRMSLTSFKEEWCSQLAGFRTTWQKLEDKARAFVKNYEQIN
jgi:hypothetical protein